MAGCDQAAWNSMSHIRNTCTDPQVHSCAVLCDFVVWPTAAYECNECQNAVPALAACQNRSAFTSAKGNHAKANCTASSSIAVWDGAKHTASPTSSIVTEKHKQHPRARSQGVTTSNDHQRKPATDLAQTDLSACHAAMVTGRGTHTVALLIM